MKANSLCSKVSPTENKKYDKKFDLAKKIAKMNISMKNYRNILTKLKKNTNKNDFNLNSLSMVSKYQKMDSIDISFEEKYKELISLYKNNDFLLNSYLIIDDEIINTSSILQKVIILLCSLYSHSNINQNLVYNQSIFKNNNTLKKILEICYNNISFSTNNLDKLAKNFNNNNIDKYLIVSNKSIKENLILKEIPNNSSILYWFVDDSFIPSYEISIDRIKKVIQQ